MTPAWSACRTRVSGEVPFAAFDTAPGMPVPSEAELKDLVRDSLPRHHFPVAIAVVDELPRNPSLKVSLRDVAALYDGDVARR